jgi:2-polyprenyl-6-methoxyphenol hydroxylase-like FAD-dependent oxidoreductase
MDKRVLICGASVAGPALAYWLGRSGYEVTVVERAARLREGGHAVDFRGSAHFKLLERMGVLDELRELQTHAGAMRFIDWRERTKLSLPREFAGGDLEVRRADLARVLYERSPTNAEYIFGDCIETFARDGNGVDVTFRHAQPRRFDLAPTGFIPEPGACCSVRASRPISVIAWLDGTRRGSLYPATKQCCSMRPAA